MNLPISRPFDKVFSAVEKTKDNITDNKKSYVNALLSAGAHFGFLKSRRHPSAKPFIFGKKNNIEIFDLEKTSKELAKALSFIEEMGKAGALGLIVGGKAEAREAAERAGKELEMPFVAGRWIGGTLTNFTEIKKRIARLEELTIQRERGELAKYTKKERLLIDREIDKLSLYFSSLSGLKTLPKFLIVIDPKKENIAVAEARKLRIPVVALAGSDTNLFKIDYAIPGNDASRQTISYILTEMVKSYRHGKLQKENDGNNGTDQRA